METTIVEQENPNFIRHFNADSIQSFINYQCALIEDGKIDALQYYIQSKALRKALDGVDSQIKDNVMSEANKYPEKKFNLFGATVEKSDTGVSYSYNECGDKEWEQLDSQIKGLTEKKKERENFLKYLKSPITLVDETTGETFVINPAIRKGSEFIKISFKP